MRSGRTLNCVSFVRKIQIPEIFGSPLVCAGAWEEGIGGQRKLHIRDSGGCVAVPNVVGVMSSRGDIIYLLTASKVHIYTQTIRRTTQITVQHK